MNYIEQRSWIAAIAATACLGCVTPVMAQDNVFKFEITPYIAQRVGGTFDEKDGAGRVEINDSSAEGILFNIAANANGQYEFIYAHQSTDADTAGFFPDDPTIGLDVEYFQFGGTYLFDGDNTRPFVALTVGVAQFDPKLPDTDSDSLFSASLGGGVQIRARERLGIRLEARVFATLVDNNSDIFCGSDQGAGGCLIRIEGNTLTQWEARAGFVFRF